MRKRDGRRVQHHRREGVGAGVRRLSCRGTGADSFRRPSRSSERAASCPAVPLRVGQDRTRRPVGPAGRVEASVGVVCVDRSGRQQRERVDRRRRAPRDFHEVALLSCSVQNSYPFPQVSENVAVLPACWTPGVTTGAVAMVPPPPTVARATPAQIATRAQKPITAHRRTSSPGRVDAIRRSRVMRMRGLEPPRAEAHTDLNRARLPIPPHPRGRPV